MTWESTPHTKCAKPFFNLSPSNSVWRCDHPGCGKRWRMTRTQDATGRHTIEWMEDMSEIQVTLCTTEHRGDHAADVRIAYRTEVGGAENTLLLLDEIDALVSIILTEALHPEFGTEWQEPDGILWKMAQERDVALAEIERLRARLAAVLALAENPSRYPCPHGGDDEEAVNVEDLRAELAEPTSNKLQGASKLEVGDGMSEAQYETYGYRDNLGGGL